MKKNSNRVHRDARETPHKTGNKPLIKPKVGETKTHTNASHLIGTSLDSLDLLEHDTSEKKKALKQFGAHNKETSRLSFDGSSLQRR